MRPAHVIISSDPPIVVLDRLNTAFNHRPNSRGGDVRYHGHLWDRGFRITRRPLLLELGDPPVVCGRIAPCNGGTRIELSIRPTWSALYLCTLLTMGVSLFHIAPGGGGLNSVGCYWLLVFLCCLFLKITAICDAEGTRAKAVLTEIIAPVSSRTETGSRPRRLVRSHERPQAISEGT